MSKIRVAHAHAHAGAEASPTALTTRAVDFWLLGGASILLWLAAFGGQHLRASSWAFDRHFQNLPAFATTFTLFVSYPHFMASYKLAYEQGPRFALRFWFQLIAVPILLVTLITISYMSYLDAQTARGALDAMNRGFTQLGLSPNFGRGPVGRELMGALLNFMLFTVGWHYSKQAFGCMLAYARFDGYPLTALQRNVLKLSLFSIWWASFTYLNRSTQVLDMRGVPYVPLGLPAYVYYVFFGVFAASALAFAFVVLFGNFRDHGKRPSANFLVPWVAFVVWWIPPLIQMEYLVFVVPLFHGLQYLAFIYRVESTRLEREHAGSQSVRGAAIALGLFVAGFLSFEFLPNNVDVALNTDARFEAWFFVVGAHIFINVHHYFIDNVLWRSSTREVRQYLN